MTFRELLRNAWRPHRDSNPGFSLERPVSGAAGRADRCRLATPAEIFAHGMNVTTAGRTYRVHTEPELLRLLGDLTASPFAA